MKQILNVSILYIFLITGCGKNEVLITEKKGISDEFSASEIELISQFLDSIAYNEFNYSMFEWSNPMLVPDSTNFRLPKPWLIDLYKRKYPEDEHMLKNLITINQKKYHLDKNYFPKINGLEIIADSEFAYYINRKNKDSLGVGFYCVEFSRPYVDEKNNRSVIYLRKFSEDWDEENYIWLKKENGTWKFYDKIIPNDWP